MAMNGTAALPFLIIFHGLRSLHADGFMTMQAKTMKRLTTTGFCQELL